MIMNVPSNDEIGKIKDILGYTTSKNLLENTATTTTRNGITFTVNIDGSVTLNGTATSQADLPIKFDLNLPNGEYILNGCPDGGDTNTYRIIFNKGGTYLYECGDGNKFTVNDETIVVIAISVMPGQVLDNVTFYPMIRRASVTDDTYEPYLRNVDTRLNVLQNVLQSALQSAINDLKWTQIFDFSERLPSKYSNRNLNATIDFSDYSEIRMIYKHSDNSSVVYDRTFFVNDIKNNNNQLVFHCNFGSVQPYIERSSPNVLSRIEFGTGLDSTYYIRIYGRK